MAVSKEKQSQIRALLEQGLSCGDIADKLGVGVMVAAGFKAAMTRANGRSGTEIADALEATFGLERDLQKALRYGHNIEQLEPGLKIKDGGKEEHVAAGFIDIKAQDKDGNIVVIELKAGTADRETIGQVLSYMGCFNQPKVRGIIVAGDFAPAAVLALGALPNVQLRRYTFHFSFETVNPRKLQTSAAPTG